MGGDDPPDLTDAQRGLVIAALDRALANESILLLETRKMQWDVGGAQALTLHQLWTGQVREMSDLADTVAARIRALGGYPTATATGFVELTSLEEHPGCVPSATAAVCILVADHERVLQELEGAAAAAEGARDHGTASIVATLIQRHERMADMLRPFVADSAHAPEGTPSAPAA